MGVNLETYPTLSFSQIKIKSEKEKESYQVSNAN